MVIKHYMYLNMQFITFNKYLIFFTIVIPKANICNQFSFKNQKI